MAIALHRHAGELPAADDDDLAAVLLELFDQRDEVAVAADDDEGVDVIVGETHLQGVERHGDVGAVLVAAGGHVALHHADRMLCQQAAVVADALPVAVGDLGDDLAALLDRLEDEADVELAADRVLDTNLDVVKVYENRNAGTTGRFCNVHSQSAAQARGSNPGSVQIEGWSTGRSRREHTGGGRWPATAAQGPSIAIPRRAAGDFRLRWELRA